MSNDLSLLSETPAAAVRATHVSQELRSQFLPKHFGPLYMLRVEMGTSDWLQNLCADYVRGPLNYMELSNGGAYLVPGDREHFDIRVEGYGLEARVSADHAGILATVYALNALIWRGHEPLQSKCDQLLDYIQAHRDMGTVRRAIG